MDIRELDLRRNVSAIDVAKEATYSHAPPSAGLDISNFGGSYPLEANGKVIPFNCHADFSDPLTGFLSQSAAGVTQTEAERAGADRFGQSWPMIRAQRLHSGDRSAADVLMRRAYAHSRIGQIFTPLEIPQDPRWAAHPKAAYPNQAPPD